jgi:hypothetical protein
MAKRALIFGFGMLLVASGCLGIVVYERERETEQRAYRARIEAEQQKAEEERTRAEGLVSQLDSEKEKAREAEGRLLAEETRRRDEERLRQRQEEERQARRVGEESQRRSQPKAGGQKGKQKDSERYRHYQAGGDSRGGNPSRSRESVAQGAVPGKPPGGNRSPEPQPDTTVLRFDFDPLRSPELALARVHAGDRVSIRVQRNDGPDLELFMGLAAVLAPTDGPRYRGYLAAPEGSSARTLMITRIKDKDQFCIEPDRDLGRAIAHAVESPAGVILKLKAGRAAGPHPGRAMGTRRSLYRIEVTIETANPWNIKPRRLV